MTEIVRYSLIGKEDLALGTGTFEVRLADGRVAVLSKIDIGALLNDASISTQDLTLGALTLTGLTVSGTLTLGSVTFTGDFDLTSGQIKFPATQVPSTDPNTLDDYEEGTWTPTLGGTATYTTQTGTYIKIGKLVFITCVLVVNAIGTGTTQTIAGLPSAWIPAVNSPLKVGYTTGLSQAVVSIDPYVGSSTFTIYLYSRTAAATLATLNTILTSGSQITLGGCYQVE